MELENEVSLQTVLIRIEVVLAVLQAGGRSFVKDDRRVRVHLQNRRRAMRREGSLRHSLDGAGFIAAGGDEEQVAGLTDSAQALRKRVARNLFDSVEEPGVILHSLRVQGHHAGAGRQGARRLVEANVAIGTNAE